MFNTFDKNQKFIDKHSYSIDINHKLIPQSVINIIISLKKNDFQAYIVGGAVRDMICGIVPKDFDLATNAKPDEIKNLIANAFIIGRRFKIVIVPTPDGEIEITTFRKQGLILKQANLFSNNIVDDSKLRDLSINALYYDIVQRKVIDFFKGLVALNNKEILLIGNPQQRFEKDPVIILRIIRVVAKLNFAYDDKLKKLIQQNKPLINKVNKSRMLEEFKKTFINFHAIKNFDEFFNNRILLDFFNINTKTTQLEKIFYKNILQSTVNRLKINMPVIVEFVLAGFLWHWVKKQLNNQPVNYVNFKLVFDKVIEIVNINIEIRNRAKKKINDILWLQYCFNNYNKKQVANYVFNNASFRAAFDIYKIRMESKDYGISKKVFDFWLPKFNSKTSSSNKYKNLKINQRYKNLDYKKYCDAHKEK